MNELQQVLLIFAVVVIAGLYFLSRSRQADSKKQGDAQNKEAKSKQQVVEPKIEEKMASQALNELGSAHIPVSDITEKRVFQSNYSAETAEHSHELSESTGNATDENLATENLKQEAPVESTTTAVQQSIEDDAVHPNQGKLFFGDEFDDVAHSESSNSTLTEKNFQETIHNEVDLSVDAKAESDSASASKGKHHVLIVDDPGMTGEISEDQYAPDYVKPSFGIPEEQKQESSAPISSMNKEPEVFVLMVMGTGDEFEMTKVNQALYGVGLTLNEQSIFVKKDNMGNSFIKVANLLEPGTFPSENLEDYSTPGVAMILELPTTVRAPAAMHELIMMARKVSQRLNARLYNMERHLIKESDLQSMRDSALDYESEPLAQ